MRLGFFFGGKQSGTGKSVGRVRCQIAGEIEALNIPRNKQVSKSVFQKAGSDELNAVAWCSVVWR